MSDGKLVSYWEEELRKAQSLEELKQKYEEAKWPKTKTVIADMTR